MLASNSRIRTKTIFCSFSGMRSMAKESPEGAGPICIHSRSTVPPSCGSNVNRQIAEGYCGSSTAQASRFGGSHSTMWDVVAHSPNASCLLRPTNRAPRAGPPPSSHSTDCSSELMRGISSMSDTSLHT